MQGTGQLVYMVPGHTEAGEVDLIGSDLLVAELIGGDTKETAELRAITRSPV
jgi:hypothetical protein